jgi:hypothetical protein
VSLAQILAEVEAAGVTLRLEGEKVRIRFPEPFQRDGLAGQIAFLRANKEKVVECLQRRGAIPSMPEGVRLIEWNLMEPPIIIETFAVVTDPALFARSTLAQLRTALPQPKRWVGWSIPQLIDRLRQVGVTVAVETGGGQR